MKETTNTKFFVYRSEFHGGTKIYEGDSIKEAIKVEKSDHNNRNCCCGGCNIKVSVNGGDKQPLEQWMHQFTIDELLKMGFSY